MGRGRLRTVDLPLEAPVCSMLTKFRRPPQVDNLLHAKS